LPRASLDEPSAHTQCAGEFDFFLSLSTAGLGYFFKIESYAVGGIYVGEIIVQRKFGSGPASVSSTATNSFSGDFTGRRASSTKATPAT